MDSAHTPQSTSESKSASFVEVLANTSRPLEVGEIAFESERNVRTRDPNRPINFSFRYHSLKFSAEVPAKPENPIVLSAVLGVLPYSVENAFGRRAAKAIIQRAHVPNGRLWIDDNTRVHLEVKAVPPRPRTPVSVLSTVTAMLMEAKPYLDLLEVALRRRRRLRQTKLA